MIKLEYPTAMMLVSASYQCHARNANHERKQRLAYMKQTVGSTCATGTPLHHSSSRICTYMSLWKQEYELNGTEQPLSNKR